MGEHGVHHVRLAHRRSEIGYAVSRGQVFRHPAAGAVGHNGRPRRRRGQVHVFGLRFAGRISPLAEKWTSPRPLPRRLPQHVIDAHRQRVFFAQVAARRIDHSQPVGIGVLAETDIGARLGHGRKYARQIFGGRLGRMGELAVGLLAEHRDAARKFVQEPPPQDTAGAAVGIQHHAEPPLANPLGVDRIQNRQEMRGNRIVAPLTASQAILGQPGRRVGAIAMQNLAARRGRNHAAVGRKQLQPVVGRGIVAGSDLDGPGRLELPQQHADGGRGRDAGVDRRASEGLQPGLNGQREHSARGAAVASDQDVARRQRCRKRGGIANRHLRRQCFAHNATQARNANDRFAHDFSLIATRLSYHLAESPAIPGGLTPARHRVEWTPRWINWIRSSDTFSSRRHGGLW